MKILKKIGIIVLMVLCIVLIICKWILWFPYIFFIFPFTGIFMHEYDFVMLPTYWLMVLGEKFDKLKTTTNETR